MQLHLQKCTDADLDQLAEISKQTFVNAFEKDNNPEDFKNYVNTAFKKSNIALQLQEEQSFFYFVFNKDDLAGYFKLNIGDAQTDLKTEDTIELERIYVRQEFQGMKIGMLMLSEAIEIGRELNKKFLWLGVWEKNVNAIRFYQKNGFVKFDTHPYYIGKDRQTDWLMKLEIKKPLQ